MDFLLSVDLSTVEGSLALHRGEECVYQGTLGSTLRHTEAFLPRLQEALTEAKITLPQISAYLTTIGPGSFTGLRIALANLKAIALVHRKPIETFRNSEIRLLHSLAQSPYAGSSAVVLTQASLNRIALGEFSLNEKGVTLMTESIIDVPVPPSESSPSLYLHDSQTLQWRNSWPQGEHREVHLHAAMLATFRTRAKSRQVLATEKEWMELAPLYLGSRF